MTRDVRHAWAAAIRTVRQAVRSRFVMLAAIGAATLTAALLGDVPDGPRVFGVLSIALNFAIITVSAGVPGDDVASGALANDLLAGTPTFAPIVGAVVGVGCAAVPAGLITLAIAGPRLLTIDAATAAGGAGFMLLGAAAMASMAVALGTILPGRAAVVPMIVIAIGGEVPSLALPLERYPPAAAEFIRAVHGALPLPFHVRAGAELMVIDQPVAAHVWPLLLGTITALGAGAAILRFRIATGRWS